MQDDSIILEIEELTKTFYALVAVDKVSFQVRRGQILGIIGPNGSGKTTLFNCITGVYKPDAGRIIYEGENLAGLSVYNIAKRGIRRTFQTIRLFKDMSVAENIYSGYYTHAKQNTFHALTHLGRYKQDEYEVWAKVKEAAEFFEISKYLRHKAMDLPYGVQRKVEVARAFISEPKIIILDEPAAGMNDTEKAGLTSMISKISARGVTVLMIEHDMNVLMNLSERVIVLNNGGLVTCGLPQEVQSNPEVIKAYMGADEGEF
ncbi:MAG: ABC transporter ATP-binding protein [Deferribacteraceae bacterium]|jgi:branched-chain amino acid transport system ATP-binding protein|nr:ABC transporter ATP-binding protein [Deferribacteraceae bacterium]